MINKIGLEFGKGSFYSNIKNKKTNESIRYNSIPKSLEQNNYQSIQLYNSGYFVKFTGTNNQNSSIHKMSKLENILYYSDTPAKNLINTLKIEAKESGFDQITTLHVIKHGLVELNKYIEDLDSGKKDYDYNNQPPLALFFCIVSCYKMISDPELRKLIHPLIKDEIVRLDKIISSFKSESHSSNKNSFLSDDLTDSIWALRKEDEPVNAYTIMRGALVSDDDVTKDIVENFKLELNSKIMINNKKLKERASFTEYEKKANNVLKNLTLGTNIFLTYDNDKDSPDNFLDTLYKVSQKNKDKITYTELNQNAKSEYFNHIIKTLAKDKSKQHIVAANPIMMHMHDSTEEQRANGLYNLTKDFAEFLLNPPSNVRFLFYDTKNNYYSFVSSPFSIYYKNFVETSVPSLNTMQMVKSFKENPVLMKDIQKPFSKNAIEKVVEASTQLEGAFPEKTQNLMKKIVSYYIDKKEINDKDVSNYLKEATNLFKRNNDDSSIDVIFDTGKSLNNILGKTSTKKEAAAIVKQIKSNKMGTKGIIIYSQDGMPGSGRRFTTKAIAGEAKVPYIEMNTMDFGTKEVSIFDGNVLSPEASIKKLFSMVKTQAEANANKSAVLFIDNFEYFSIGELVSIYHQKAMAQLLREMEKAEAEGLNILVVGSVSNPYLIGKSAMKSFKFTDSIEVSSPAFNQDERAIIIEHDLKEKKYKLAGTPQEQQEIIDSAAQITIGLPFISLKNLVNKAHSVAAERGHKKIEKADFTEAYLQITTGRPAITKINDHEKLITASHECGHATNLEVMNNLAKTMGKPWHIPNKVNFVTLDPRGFYGGAVYHGKDINKETSFENVFAAIIASFGGNSSESRFFGMEGSLGISCDMESIRGYAESMVKVMGLGAKTGKMAIDYGENLSDKMKSIIEDDERVIINNAKIASDLITEVYEDFNKEFTKKYAMLVGTGECLIDGNDFRKELNNWKSSQTPEKQEELKLCDELLLKIIECTKKGLEVKKK